VKTGDIALILFIALIVACIVFVPRLSGCGGSTTTIVRDTVVQIDTTLVSIQSIKIASLEAMLDREHRALERAQKDYWKQRNFADEYKALYEKALADTTGHAVLPVARLDTVVGSFRDTVRVAYVFPPVNRFDSLFIGLAPRPVEIQERVVTVTKEVRKNNPLWENAVIFLAGFGAHMILNPMHP
jgi:hypothetical protein